MNTYTQPPHVPVGMSHVEYVLREAEQAFLHGRRNDGVVNLAHALHVLATKQERLDDSGLWFRRITNAAHAWEPDGV